MVGTVSMLMIKLRYLFRALQVHQVLVFILEFGTRFCFVLACETGTFYFNKCYKVLTTNGTKDEQLQACKKINPKATLATILSPDTNQFITKLVTCRSFIDLENVNGEWVWPFYNNLKATYLPWYPDQPSGDCCSAEIWPENDPGNGNIGKGLGRWNDLPAFAKRCAVCQWDSKGTVYSRGSLVSYLVFL